jgi:hypothetical protein
MADSDPVNLSMGAARQTRDVVREWQRTPRPERGRPRKPPQPDDSFGPQSILFTIDSYTLATGIAICTVKWRSYGMTEVSDEVNGKVDVKDPAGCYFDEDAADLVGRWGVANYMVLDGDTEHTGVWVVVALCCPP